ncbi:MAG: hypothetical protein HPY30_00900 [Gammaproteobacteria bacterium (ex Lamellibrachia satsuma)]|nr:MAG: hypothetical protein HPY30_00900 [Gammaproteobacteria bacterium (ex Lamellibrachia satsuma)]
MSIRENQKRWAIYKKQLSDGEVEPLSSKMARNMGQGFGLLGSSGEQLKGSLMNDVIDEVIKQLKNEEQELERLTMKAMESQGIKKTKKQLAVFKGKYPDMENKLFELGMIFLDAARRGNADKVKEIEKTGFPVNFKDPIHGMTALHYAASSSAKEVVRELVNSKKCDYLLRDQKGRTALDLSYEFGRHRSVERLLLNKTIGQAKQHGMSISDLACGNY